MTIENEGEKPVQTSDTHPLHVDWLPEHAVRAPGRIGMTKAPGKKDPHGWHARWERDMGKDLERLRRDYRASILVTLMEQEEMRVRGMEGLLAQVVEHGMRSMWLPIVDLDTPKDMRAVATVVGAIVAAAKAGQNVVIHCKGGYGRTGTLAACVQVYTGTNPETAIRQTREARAGTIQTPQQEVFVYEYAHWLATRR